MQVVSTSPSERKRPTDYPTVSRVSPSLPTPWIARERLHARLKASNQTRLTAITGPPGCGKSVLLAGWARYYGTGQTAWVSLSDSDNDDPQSWERLAEELRQPREPLPAVLVIDDIHLIHDTESVLAFERMVEDLSAHFHIVLSGRHFGDVGLHRLGMNTTVTQVSGDELAFTVDEAVALASAFCSRQIAREPVEALAQRSEGWAVGLRLGCVLLAGERDTGRVVDEFSGSSHLVAEYFTQEVMTEVPADIALFLRETAILDVLTAELCEAVTGRSDADKILQELSTRNLFVERIGPTDEYRYHTLFADFLRHELRLEGLAAYREAHMRAARRFEQSRDDRSAVRDYVAAEEYEQAVERGAWSVAQQIESWLLDNDEVLIPGNIPERVFAGDRDRLYASAVGSIASNRLDAAARSLRLLEDGVDGAGEPAYGEAVVSALGVVLDHLRMDCEGAVRRFEALTARLGGRIEQELDGSHDRQGVSWLRALDTATLSMARLAAASAYCWLDHPDVALPILDAEPYCDAEDNRAVRLSVLAMAAVREGRLREAERLAQRALAAAELVGRSEAPATLEGRLALAEAQYEFDEIPAAERTLYEAEKICLRSNRIALSAVVGCEMVKLQVSRGNVSEASHRMRDMQALLLGDRLPRFVERRLREAEIRCLVASGDVDGASALAQSMPVQWRRPEISARIHLSCGRPDRALSDIGSHPGEVARGRVGIERLLLQARAYVQLGNSRAAEHSARRALDVAQVEGYRRVFLEQPPQVLDLLKAAPGEHAESFLSDVLDRPGHRPVASGRSLPMMVEPLTHRERELLGYLPSHLSQYEIARRMYISANTVKTHVKGLYRKLGATSRSEAVEVARFCGLLPDDA